MYSVLLEQHLDVIRQANNDYPVLDLACGTGRNGLFLVEQGIPVVFSDVNSDVLKEIQQKLALLPNNENVNNKSCTWQIDFEQKNSLPLNNKQYRGIIVYRYLHRPLMTAIKQAIMPGGFIIYETFIEQQAEFGRPKNPAFLLKSKELNTYFNNWHIHHSFEGIITSPLSGNKQAIAQIVAQKSQ